ncbi:MAG: MaoC family dehydratase [Parvularculaceae bacterium]
MPIVREEELEKFVGKEVGVSDWLVIDQSRIDQFAEVTEDFQFIHIDPEAAAKTPFGGTIAHGFLTLSMLSKLASGSALGIEGATISVNYGFDKIRFVEPVRAGAKIRGRFVLTKVAKKPDGRWFLTYGCTVEIDGNERPALIADWLSMQIV